MFGFQRLDVYRCAIQLLCQVVPLSERVPQPYSPLADQLRRASLSIPLNIAEGSGKAERDARRFYMIARGSALECAAILDSFEALGLFEAVVMGEARELLNRIVSMLTKLSRS